MNKRIVALLIASTLATAAFGQSTMTTDTAKEKAKAKQAEVQVATISGTDATQNRMQEQNGVAEAKAAKNAPKVLLTKADRSRAVQATTAMEYEGADVDGRVSAAGSVAAKKDKDQPRALKTTKEKQEAVAATRSLATP